MRITGTTGAARAPTASAARRAASGSFSVSAPATTPGPTATTSLRSVSTVDALIALQGVEDPAERRKRAVGRGRQALDVLDALKVGVLGGDLDPMVIGRLKATSESLKGSTGDPGLDGVLAEIDLRVAVELAKAGIR